MMKKTNLWLTLATCSLLAISSPFSGAQEDSSAQPPEWQMKFENLELTERQEFVGQFHEATRLFNQKRIFEALDVIIKCEKIFENYPSLANLKGACYVEFRDFNKARIAFEKAASLSPENGDVLFNLAELDFVTSNWKASEERFTKALAFIDEKNIRMRRLVEFKILLSKMKLGKQEEVMELAKKYGFDDDSPFHYYAEAALAYQVEDDEKAAEWLKIARRIFRDVTTLTPWQDTLIEFGYIRSFYGDDLEEDLETTSP